MNEKEMIKQRENKYKETLKNIRRVERELEFLKKCITYGVDPKTRECITQKFVDDRINIIKTYLDGIMIYFYHENSFKEFLKEVYKEAKEILECLLEA